MDEYIASNREMWDEMVPIHVASAFYDVASFREGRSTLLQIERDEVGDVTGKTLLHLQCHFGMDSLSWVRAGAMVTAVDFSPEAIRVARGLAEELAIDAAFIESDIYDLETKLSGQFDIVFASYGVLCWLPDFPRWAAIAARFVNPGGFLYIVDGHPMGGAIDDATKDAGLKLGYPYFSSPQPMVFEEEGTYADPEAKLKHNRSYEFSHHLGEVVTALADCGLRIEFLHEFPYAAWQRLPAMTKGDDGYYRLPEDQPSVPFMFSVKATRPLHA